jgi:hypothetical protein
MEPITIAALIGAGSQLIGGGMNFFGNKAKAEALSDTQKEAQKAQKEAQDKYNRDYGSYQQNIRNLLGDRPELQIKSTQDTLQPYLRSVQNDLLASQGRAAGSEVRRDDIRQNSADQIYRASQASRTGSDLMGAIGRIQAGEYANTRRLGGREAQERVNRIDNKTTAFQNAIKANSMYNAAEQTQREQALYQDSLQRYNQSLNFEEQSQLNQIQSGLNFAIGNVNQNAAMGSTQAAMMPTNPGNMLMAMGPSIMQMGMQQQQMQNDAARYNYQDYPTLTNPYSPGSTTFGTGNTTFTPGGGIVYGQ